jgi:hypothetical protein
MCPVSKSSFTVKNYLTTGSFKYCTKMGEWRKLHNEELRDLYSSPSIIRIIKSRTMRWAGHVARMGERKGTSIDYCGKARGKETTRKTKT